MSINVQQPTIDKNQKVRKALTDRLLTGFLPFRTLNQRVAGSNPARLTIFFKGFQALRILVEDKELFHKEKDAILTAGLKVSGYINVDDTRARHDGKNGYRTHIGNEFFAWFESTDSKSRINFLELLRAGQLDYVINEEALEYMLCGYLSLGFAMMKRHPGLTRCLL